VRVLWHWRAREYRGAGDKHRENPPHSSPLFYAHRLQSKTLRQLKSQRPNLMTLWQRARGMRAYPAVEGGHWVSLLEKLWGASTAVDAVGEGEADAVAVEATPSGDGKGDGDGSGLPDGTGSAEAEGAGLPDGTGSPPGDVLGLGTVDGSGAGMGVPDATGLVDGAGACRAVTSQAHTRGRSIPPYATEEVRKHVQPHAQPSRWNKYNASRCVRVRA
jgi:hypothetical protein